LPIFERPRMFRRRARRAAARCLVVAMSSHYLIARPVTFQSWPLS
jgi:hypothetical protein